jgi:hypothetical protein
MFAKCLSKTLAVLILAPTILFICGSVDSARSELLEEKDKNELILAQIKFEHLKPRLDQQQSELRLKPAESMSSPRSRSREKFKGITLLPGSLQSWKNLSHCQGHLLNRGLPV